LEPGRPPSPPKRLEKRDTIAKTILNQVRRKAIADAEIGPLMDALDVLRIDVLKPLANPHRRGERRRG
jgi:hypothetical protein